MDQLLHIFTNPTTMFFIGVFVAFLTVFLIGPSMMILKRRSPLSFDATVEKVSSNIKKEGWSLMGIDRIDASLKKHGRKTNMKVALINLCHPDYANEIISDEKSRHISVMMPCTISVYEDATGKVCLSNMNTAPMGWMFGGVVRKIMAGPVAKAQKKFLNMKRA